MQMLHNRVKAGCALRMALQCMCIRRRWALPTSPPPWPCGAGCAAQQLAPKEGVPPQSSPVPGSLQQRSRL